MYGVPCQDLAVSGPSPESVSVLAKSSLKRGVYEQHPLAIYAHYMHIIYAHAAANVEASNEPYVI